MPPNIAWSIFRKNKFVIILAPLPWSRIYPEDCSGTIIFSDVGLIKESEPSDQLAVSKGRPQELVQERCDTYLAALRRTLCRSHPLGMGEIQVYYNLEGRGHSKPGV